MQSGHECTIRPLNRDSEYTAFEALQRETWGDEVAEVVSGSLAKIIQKIGGIAAGAFDDRDELAGLVFGFTGMRDGKPVHWSHMLAVKEGRRNSGLGLQLKVYQRSALLEMGVQDVFWTFDPLVAKNAQINFNLLGARVLEYAKDMYGGGDDSKLFRGIGTDRFIVSWQIADQYVAEVIDGKRHFDHQPFEGSELAVRRSSGKDHASPAVAVLNAHEKRVRIEIPIDIHLLMNISIAAAFEWRAKTRQAFLHYMQNRYSVVGFYRESETERCFYCLEQLDEKSPTS